MRWTIDEFLRTSGSKKLPHDLLDYERRKGAPKYRQESEAFRRRRRDGGGSAVRGASERWKTLLTREFADDSSPQISISAKEFADEFGFSECVAGMSDVLFLSQGLLQEC